MPRALVPVFIPSLVSILLRGEQDKGAPLTEAEVLAIRDGATVVMLPADQVPGMARQRGYDDLDPKRCWPEWQRARVELPTKG